MAKRIQEVMFSKRESPSDVNDANGWTAASAKAWLRDHDMRTEGPMDDSEEKDFLHFPQFPSDRCRAGSFQALTENFPLGVQARSCEEEQDRRARREVRSLERNAARLAVEQRQEGDGEVPVLAGYAAVFDSPSVPLGFGAGFREVIRPGAFTKTLQEAPNIFALWGHDARWPLASTRAGNLMLAEDQHGLRFELRPIQSSFGDHVVESVRSGVVGEMSFAFEAVKEEFRREGDQEVRELREVKLIEVSPVVFPAYEDTEIGLRSLLARPEEMIRQLRGVGLTNEEIRVKLESLAKALRPEPDPSVVHSRNEDVKRRIRIAEASL